MRYWAAFRFLFASPNGWKNLLMTAVCMLIPAIGPLVLIGYLIEVFAPRLGEDWPGWDGRGNYPDFDFGRFAAYLERGLWPFLASLVAGLVVLMPAYLVAALPLVLVLVSHGPPAAVVAAAVLSALLMGVAALPATVVLVPVTLRAALLQEFTAAFNVEWSKDFIRRTWRKILLSTLFVLALSFPLAIAGYAMCFVGVYPAMALVFVAQWHLHFQVYRVYLARGGVPVPATGVPPPLPPG